ncbi:AraC-like DNA-binding protein [Chryseobacterium sp. JUb44]|nr:AraC-like DNA-binding protein [Chryseobacterium sp. JUb44]
MINFTKSFYNHIYTGNRKIKSDLINLGDVPYIDVDASSIKEWISLANLVKNEYRRSKNEYKELICLYLKAALVKYKRYFNLGTDSILLKKNHKSTLAQNFKELIDMKFKEWKLPKEYANEMCITPHYLSTISKAKFGKSAGTIIKERIILEAERLLKSTDLTVNEIGGRLGFSDKSNFNKYFKKYMYCTPEAFRNERSRDVEMQNHLV